jgi:hypothetical protein
MQVEEWTEDDSVLSDYQKDVLKRAIRRGIADSLGWTYEQAHLAIESGDVDIETSVSPTNMDVLVYALMPDDTERWWAVSCFTGDEALTPPKPKKSFLWPVLGITVAVGAILGTTVMLGKKRR